MPSSPHFGHPRLATLAQRARAVVLVMLCLVFVGSWPGSVVRPLVIELTAAPLPDDAGERDGTLDVVARPAGDPGSALVGVRVRAFAILEGRAYAAGEATTGADGRASLTRLPHGEHWVVAEQAGRARASQMVVIVSGPRRLDLELGAEHTLDVEVRTEQGEPIAGAEIEARGPDPFPVGARTGPSGKVTVERLGEGPYEVTIRAGGFEEIVRRRVPEGAVLVVTLGKQGALLVKVVGAAGEPVPDARVLVASSSLWPARVTQTTADGTVRIGGLEPGSYALRSVQGTRVSPIELGISVAKGEEKALELRLAPGMMVTARVVDALDEDGVGKARVTLAEGGLSPFPIEGLTDKKGLVVLGPVARGASSLAVRADGFVARGAVSVEDPPPAEVRVALVKGGTLTGRVVDARGYAIDGATIRVVGTDLEGMPIDEDPQRSSFRDAHFEAALGGPRPLVLAGELGVMPGPVPAIPHGPALSFGGAAPSAGAGKGEASEPWVSGRDGTFAAKPIPPGRVRALVRHPQYVEAMSEVVTLASEKEANVVVVLLRGGTLEGKVVDARGRGVSGARVTALASRGSLERQTRAGTDGSFAFAALPEDVTLLVSREEDTGQAAARLEVRVPEAGRRSVEITLPEARPPLPVKVSTERGAAIGNAQVSAVSLDPGEALRVTVFTSDRGEAELANARGLSLRVEVRAPGRAAKVVTTTPDTASLAVELEAAESVTGEVVANRRESIEDADVSLQTELGTRHARTDKDGVFRMSDVAAGPARLRVRAKGRAPVTRDVVIERRGGRANELPRLELAEEGVVSGTVLDGRGNPVAGARVAKDAVPTYLPVQGQPTGMATTDGRGRFVLGELPEGAVTLEAYSPELGRTRLGGVRVLAGRTTDAVKIVLNGGEAASAEPLTTGGVAVTLGETVAGLEPSEVVVVAVSEASEAERAGLQPNDLVLEVGGVRVHAIGDARARLSGPVHDDVVVKVRRGERLVTLRVPREPVRR
ncbi:MAG: hypothetical protein JWP97_950 [Labilithrix sp.]|nr:hypothetical protein [Labilithrix sp.]